MQETRTALVVPAAFTLPCRHWPGESSGMGTSAALAHMRAYAGTPLWCRGFCVALVSSKTATRFRRGNTCVFVPQKELRNRSHFIALILRVYEGRAWSW